MSDRVRDRALEAAQRERDLYRRLLELGGHEDPEPFLEEALALVVEATGARQGYLALYSDERTLSPRWWIAKGFSQDQLREVRQRVSSGIIAEAMATGELILTDAAYQDPRFQDQESVRLNQIPAVLCAPVGKMIPLGVLYLQGRSEEGPFSREDGDLVLFFVRHLSPFVERLRFKEKEGEDLTSPLRKKLKLEGIIGRGRVLAELFSQIESAAKFSIPVLLTGPSGTGKTRFAQAIYENSGRASGPFVELNCAAIPESLFESELFGAMPGAHSTATKKIEGKIAAAQGGTLFLDEIGELPLSVQAKLLQFLQSGKYFPLGSSRAEQSNVRVIAATNADLEAKVAQKAFREDLFYRLNVLLMRVPALSERREDIAPLGKFFCESSCRRYELPLITLSPRALLAMEEADWPGNIRQLGHLVESATIKASMEGARAVERRHLFPEPQPGEARAGQMTFQEATRIFQRKFLLDALKATHWNISETARRLDLTRTHVYHLIQVFEISREGKEP
jgi:Nif-specific regulatory protein